MKVKKTAQHDLVHVTEISLEQMTTLEIERAYVVFNYSAIFRRIPASDTNVLSNPGVSTKAMFLSPSGCGYRTARISFVHNFNP